MVSIMPGMEWPRRTDRYKSGQSGRQASSADRSSCRSPARTLILQTVGPAAIVVQELGTGLGCDGKAGRDRETDASHLRQPRAFAAGAEAFACPYLRPYPCPNRRPTWSFWTSLRSPPCKRRSAAIQGANYMRARACQRNHRRGGVGVGSRACAGSRSETAPSWGCVGDPSHGGAA